MQLEKFSLGNKDSFLIVLILGIAFVKCVWNRGCFILFWMTFAPNFSTMLNKISSSFRRHRMKLVGVMPLSN